MKGKLTNFMSSFLGKKESGGSSSLWHQRAGGQEDGVIRFWDSGGDPAYQVTLTDVQEADRSYRRTIEKSLLVGLSNEADICVNYDRSVSRRHCEILREGDLFFIVNHSRTNGTFLNQQTVMGKTPLSSGDLITMGRVAMRLQIEG